jgi:hypothetical protein
MTIARTARVAPRTLHVVDADNLTGGPTVVHGSGDGIFAARLSRLRALGLRVEVVAPVGSVSWRLFPVAHHVYRIETASGCTRHACRLPVGRVSLGLAA